MPSRKVTVPVGAPPGPTDVTLAVKVTLEPKIDGLALDVRETLAPSWLTICESVADVLAAKCASPA